MKKIHLLTVLLLAVFIILAPEAGNAQARGNIDVALVMDSSGSMKKTDPRSLRIPAAKLFISLLDSNDRAAVLSFSDKGHPIAGLTPVNNDANKKKLLNATDKITSKGLHTNLYGAFHKGMEVLLEAKEEGREQIIILMSDGMMDVGDPDKDSQLLTKLKLELSGELKKNNIKVYSIAFTNQSDRRLLEKLSKQTGGFYNLALTDKDFHLVFTSIFESLKSPEMLPMEKNSFLIDGSIREVTIVASKASPETDIQIIAPDGQTYSGSHQYSGISWFVSDNFDMVTVQKPVQGRWEILYSTEENNKAYIITDLKLETNFEQLYAVFGENLDIKAWLEKEGAIIRDGQVLETTDIYIELNNPDGNISNLKPLNGGNGIFYKSITPFKDGNYRLRVVAKGKTYEREKAFLFNVANLQESKEDLKAAREARKAEKAEEQEPSEEEEQESVNWSKIIVQFISLNLIIGIFVIAYMKRQSIKDFKLIGKLFKRSKDTKPLQAKTKEPEESHTEAESETEDPAEEETGQIGQVSKVDVALEDTDSEGKEAEQEGNEEEDQAPVKERVALEEAAYEEDSTEETGNDSALNNIEEEIQRLEKLKHEDGDNQTTEASENTASEKAVNTDKANAKEQSETQSPQEEIQKASEVKAEAESEEGQSDSTVEEQKTYDQAAPPEDVKESPEPKADVPVQAEVETDAEDTAKAEEKSGEDGVDDMWADAMNEQAVAEGEGEKSESNIEEQKTDDQAAPPEDVKESPEPKADVSVQAEVETDTEDTAKAEEKSGEDGVDDMWADAMNEQAAAEGEGEKPDSIDEEQKADEQISQPEEVKEPQEPKEEVKANAESVSEETVQTEEHELDEETQLAEANKANETQAEEHEGRASIPEEIKPDVDESGEGEIDDMWAAALDEQAKEEESINKTASTEVDKSKENTGLDEVEDTKGEDQMWAEALSDHTEAREETPLDSKKNPGGSSGAAG